MDKKMEQMEKKKIVIVEDDDKEAALLKEYIRRYAKESGFNFSIKRFSDGRSFLHAYPSDTDVVFMDIDLPKLNGMDTVKKLREADSEVVVVFVTNLAQYAVEGYSVDALDFIVKPVSYFNFKMKFKRALTRAEKRKNLAFWIDLKGGGKKYINTNELKYVEIRSHLLSYHTTEGVYDSWGTLNATTELLKEAPFELCNRCYLVNLKFVDGISDFDLHLGGEVLAISRMKRSGFLAALNRYLAGENKNE